MGPTSYNEVQNIILVGMDSLTIKVNRGLAWTRVDYRSVGP